MEDDRTSSTSVPGPWPVNEEVKAIDFSGLGIALDCISFEQLEARYPELARQVERLVTQGAAPEQIRRYALRRELPKEWVAWLEASARAVDLEHEIT